MKFLNIKSILLTAISVSVFTGFNSCNIDQLVDPNNPSVAAIESDASVEELNNLVAGMEAGMRIYLDTYLDDCGVIGREYYRFSGADPRFTTDLLGGGGAQLDNNTFYNVNPWSARYRVVRNGWILRHAVTNTSADLTAEEKNGYYGFAKTIQAYQMLLNLNMSFEAGIRLDTEDPDNMGPIVPGFNTCIQAIIDLLDDGANDLSNAGSTFRFALSSGFSGFDTPETFRQFNRAITARCMLYKGDYTGALNMLNESFFNIAGPLTTGTYHVYSANAGDILNDMYFPQNSSPGGNARCAQINFVPEAEAGDLRLSKVSLRDDTAFVDDLTSYYDVWVYQSNTAPICIIRNEELILIYAEAQAQNGNTPEAVNAINIIRNQAGGLSDYTGGTTTDELINEILNQRRYSLYAEGHRWIDMRRTGKLNELPLDRPDDDIWEAMPIPYDEGL